MENLGRYEERVLYQLYTPLKTTPKRFKVVFI